MKELSITDFSPNLFWDIDQTDFNPKHHIKYIVSRVLEIGTFEDWQLLCQNYSLKTIIKIAQNLRSIDPKTLAFLSVVGNIPKETFRCYTSKQSTPKHWIY